MLLLIRARRPSWWWRLRFSRCPDATAARWLGVHDHDGRTALLPLQHTLQVTCPPCTNHGTTELNAHAQLCPSLCPPHTTQGCAIVELRGQRYVVLPTSCCTPVPRTPPALTHWLHALQPLQPMAASPQQCLRHLLTAPNAAEERGLRRALYGPNALRVPVVPLWWMILLELTHPFYLFQARTGCSTLHILPLHKTWQRYYDDCCVSRPCQLISSHHAAPVPPWYAHCSP